MRISEVSVAVILLSSCMLFALASPFRAMAMDNSLVSAATLSDRVRWLSDTTRDDPVPHRRLHGELVGTQTRFNLLLPAPEQFEGMLIQHLQGSVGGDEFHGLRRGDHHAVLRAGAAFLESNQGHVGADMSGLEGDPSVLEWRASVATAKLARELIANYYETDPPQIVVEGGSAGGMRVLACMRNAPELYAGGLAYMINRTDLTPFNWSVTVWASQILLGRMQALAHDPARFFDAATDEERQALSTLYRAGFPRGAESQLGYNPLWAMAVQHVGTQDADYFRAFWEDAVYSADRARAPAPTEERYRVSRVVAAGELRARAAEPTAERDELHNSLLAAAPDDMIVGLSLDGLADARALAGYELVLQNGTTIVSTGGVGNTVTAILTANAFGSVSVGDYIAINNHKLIAFAHYHRFASGPGYAGMRQFWVDGKPLPGQRPQPAQSLEPIKGKLMVMQHLLDREAWPTVAVQFFADMQAGNDPSLPEHMQLYWTQAAQHSPTLDSEGPAQAINYRGIVDQGKIDLMRWVTKERSPRESTSYELRADGELALTNLHDQSEGVQPALSLSATVPARGHHEEQHALDFTAVATARAGDTLESLEFDALGDGKWEVLWRGNTGKLTHQWHHAYTADATGIATVRVTASRRGQRIKIPLENLATVPVHCRC